MNIQFYTDELQWCFATLDKHPGSFLHAFVQTCLAADADNYEHLRPVVAIMMRKYPAQ